MNTRRVYKENVYLKELNAAVTGVRTDHGRTLITFDQTIFFPTGGGQSHDIGKIIWNSKELNVTDVYEYDGEIYHQVETNLPGNPHSHVEGNSNAEQKEAFGLSKGDEVRMLIDWNHRFDNMQRHCGEHILSGAFYKLYRGINRGFHMGKDYMTIDISLEDSQFDKITWELAKAAELETNRVIWENLPVITTHYDTKEEASKEPLRKELKIPEDITIVRIGSFDNPSDAVACCGTHPSHSGQVGMLKIYKIEPNKGMTRIYFDAGERAFTNYQREFDILTEISNKLSAGKDDLLDKFQSMEVHTQGIKDKLHSLERILVDSRAEAINSSLIGVEPGAFVKVYDDIAKDIVQAIGRHFTKSHPLSDDILLVLSSWTETFAILYASSASKFHCGDIVKDLGRSRGGKGGGNKTSAQVTFSSSEELNDFLRQVKSL